MALDLFQPLKLYNCTTVTPDGNLAPRGFFSYQNDGIGFGK
jgi:hypothetical protein